MAALIWPGSDGQASTTACNSGSTAPDFAALVEAGCPKLLPDSALAGSVSSPGRGTARLSWVVTDGRHAATKAELAPAVGDGRPMPPDVLGVWRRHTTVRRSEARFDSW